MQSISQRSKYQRDQTTNSFWLIPALHRSGVTHPRAGSIGDQRSMTNNNSNALTLQFCQAVLLRGGWFPVKVPHTSGPQVPLLCSTNRLIHCALRSTKTPNPPGPHTSWVLSPVPLKCPAGPRSGYSLIINKLESVRTQRGELHGHVFYGVFVTVLLCILLVYPSQPMTAQRLVMFEFPTLT